MEGLQFFRSSALTLLFLVAVAVFIKACQRYTQPWYLKTFDDSFSRVGGAADPTCIGLSKEVACLKCWETTHRCMPGQVPVDPWLVATAKTQRELQVDEPWHRLQMLEGHNSYNARAYGYGVNDTCPWPPPYPDDCDLYANHEFSHTDLLNMGIRAVEFDNWYCFGEMRLNHLWKKVDLECSATDRLFSDGIKEIADWLNLPGNGGEMVRIFINEKFDQEHDELVNGPLGQYLGKRILSPAELADAYGGEWPTPRQMRKAGKNVVVATGPLYRDKFFTHGDKYIHKFYWLEKKVRKFTNYPECGSTNPKTDVVRFYSECTHFWNKSSQSVKHDGPTKGTGVIYDFTEYVKCRVQYPATDMITPDLVKTAMFTWAEGQPDVPLTAESCIWISNTDWRWYLSKDCSTELHYACQSQSDPDDWIISTAPASYSPSGDSCPGGHTFSVPQDGFRHQKLKEASGGNSVWINFTPWLPLSAKAAS